MEFFSIFSSNGDFPFLSILLALIVTLLCCFISLFPFRFLKFSQSDKPKACDCDCTRSDFRGDTQSMAVTASVMNGGEVFLEQLVPEITTHALSYLDYPSLCKLSMTNSSMRRAANDDNAWKALYHKDFTMEQDSITPSNGWKAYYAATRAIMNSNQRFFNVIRERSLPEMGRLWLNADYVKCVHPSGELFTGYNGVIGSWQLAFNWEPGFDFQVRDVRSRVLTDMAWLTMQAAVGMDNNLLNVSNVFEFHDGRWFMVHHHSSVMLTIGHAANQPPILG